ncbi:alkylhydroperoxidase [Massilia sp. KIM]|uniref:carboxymuconolactone decarboxylase family protein n=1 Tax=Massilia sp. KIM TaxID=1955422 RepID=UPI00098EB2BD|nr:carboxymuconolactone decarboxylase family protein [Massilia sp. KIM]OON63028.1 alkylhydroperoxidase [Massilia sp. KIM]
MSYEQIPQHYLTERAEHTEVFAALETLGRAVAAAGPVGPKEAHLIKMAAAIAIGSEGSTHSHVRRALEAGATAEEIRHAILLLMCTVGYPTVSRALSWADDVIRPQRP